MQPIPSATALPPAVPRSGEAVSRPGTALPPPGEAAAMPLTPSPSLAIDPALNLVVLEFRDDSGAVVNTIPSARQLAAYRTGEKPG